MIFIYVGLAVFLFPILVIVIGIMMKWVSNKILSKVTDNDYISELVSLFFIIGVLFTLGGFIYELLN